jgi:hypothetical protein
MATKMTSGDWKGDTARGARYLANRNAAFLNRKRKPFTGGAVKSTTGSDIFGEPVNIRKLVAKLSFDEDGLEEAAMENAKLLFEAARYRVKKMRRSAKSKFAYETAFAELRTKGRQRKTKGEGRGPTESAIADEALADETVQQLKTAMDDANAQEELSKSLLECYRVRRDMIKAIATIRASEISAELREVRENLKRDELDKEKSAMRQRVSELNAEEDDSED